MKKMMIVLGAVLSVALLVSGPAVAGPYAGYGDDDGSELFVPSPPLFSVEFGDITESNPDLFSGFGFFFESDPLTNILLFDPTDAIGNIATADFNLGVVLDVDGGSVQDVFTPIWGDNIGFWYTILDGGETTFYTVAAMNGGTDFAQTYPILPPGEDAYLIEFTVPGGSSLSLHYVSGIAAVPEPTTMLLLGSGLIGLAVVRRRFSS